MGLKAAKVFDALRGGERTSKEKVGSLVGGGINVVAFSAALAWLLGLFGIDVPEGAEGHLMALIVAAIAAAGAIKNAVAWWGRERASREALRTASVAAQVQRELARLQYEKAETPGGDTARA